MSYIEVFAEDQSVIPYRPKIARATGSWASAILLQQILHYWRFNDRQPFYKFAKPCTHELYREGDSWIERLACSVDDLRSAMKPIGTKITKGISKASVRTVEKTVYDPNGRCLNAVALVLYWTDSSRVTWYDLNAPLFEDLVQMCYGGGWQQRIVENPVYLDKVENPIYLGKRALPVYPVNGGSDVTFNSGAEPPHSESTSKSTTEKSIVLPVRGKSASAKASPSPAAALGSVLHWLPEAVRKLEPISIHGLTYDAICLWCQLDPRPSVLTQNLHYRVLRTAKYVEGECQGLPRTQQTDIILAAMERWYCLDHNGQRKTAPTPEQIKDNWIKLTLTVDEPTPDEIRQNRQSKGVKDEREQRREQFDAYLDGS